MNSLPLFRMLFTEIFPPNFSTKSFTNDSPKPFDLALTNPAGARKKRSKMRSKLSGFMPVPWSSMEIRVLPDCEMVIKMLPLSGENLTALEMRFKRM